MVFHDLVRERALRPVDRRRGLGDRLLPAREPGARSAPRTSWLTDFVGWLPMPEGGEHEAALTADYNAEMIEHIARFPRVRDRAIFVGDPDDVVPDAFGPELPAHPPTGPSAHYDFAGYVTGFDPADVARPRAAARRARLPAGRAGLRRHRRRLGGRPFAPAARHRRVSRGAPSSCPGLRMIVVAGPRIDPALARRSHDGLEVRAYVPGPLPPPRRLRPRRRPGRADDGDGADREPAAVPLLPAAAPLRAELPRPPPARPLRRRARMDFDTATPGVDRRGDRRRDRPRGRLPAGRRRTAPRGRPRRIAELL